MKTNTFSEKCNTFPTLFPVESHIAHTRARPGISRSVDTNFNDILRKEFSLLKKDPGILKKIEHDLDCCYAMTKKERRLADKAWQDRQTLSLGIGSVRMIPGVDVVSASRSKEKRCSRLAALKKRRRQQPEQAA